MAVVLYLQDFISQEADGVVRVYCCTPAMKILIAVLVMVILGQAVSIGYLVIASTHCVSNMIMVPQNVLNFCWYPGTWSKILAGRVWFAKKPVLCHIFL